MGFFDETDKLARSSCVWGIIFILSTNFVFYEFSALSLLLVTGPWWSALLLSFRKFVRSAR